MTKTQTWTLDDHDFILFGRPDRMVLLQDERVVMAGPATLFAELARRIRKSGTRGAKNAGQRWTDDEDEKLRQGWAETQVTAEHARRHGRSSGAIRSRLVHLGLIEDDRPHDPTGRRRGA